jgi:TolB-like protein
MRFRIGLGLGEVTIRENVVHGHCVNVAARLQQAAEPGGILVTSAVRDAVHGDPEIALRAIGSPPLKNIAQGVETFAVDRAPASTVTPTQRPRQALPSSRTHAIAVLAFANLFGDPANEHLCEGFSEDTIANLGRFRNLTVIARHSAFLFSLKSAAARDIGRRLGADYLLTGSLRRLGRRIRIVLELINAETESVTWSDRLDATIDELFDLQEEIVTSVAARLAIQIDAAESKRESQHPRCVPMASSSRTSSHVAICERACTGAAD